jgi:plastocyanin
MRVAFPSVRRGLGAPFFATLLLALVAGTCALAHAQGMAMPGMDDAAMRRMAAAHVPRTAQPAQASRTGAVTATFMIGPSNSLRFDADGSTVTAIDTVHITAGDAVKWQWVSGTHTVTSGTGGADPNAGLLFDVAIDTGSRTFTYTFATPGTYPFFCVYHEDFTMKGVVVVTAPAAVPEVGTGLGFSAPPAPNPTRGEVAVRFAVAHPGRARLDVLDPNGRRVAMALDAWMEPGAHEVTWDGRAGGRLATAGVYYLRLRLPGYDATREIVLAR